MNCGRGMEGSEDFSPSAKLPPTRSVIRDLGYQILFETKRNIGEHFISGACSSTGLINEREWGRQRAEHLVNIEALRDEYKVHFHRHTNWLAVNDSINDIVYQDLFIKENLIPNLDDKNFQDRWVSQGGYFDGNPSIGGTEWKQRELQRYVDYYHYNVTEEVAKIENLLKR